LTGELIAAAQAGDGAGQIWIYLGGVGMVVLGWVGSIIVKKFREPTRIETMWERLDSLTKTLHGDPNDANAPGVLVRLEKSESRNKTMGHIIASLVRQWPADHVPHLNPDWLADLDEDTMPLDHPWRVRP